MPALLALSANVIEVGGIAYIKTSLSGPQYSKLDTSALTGALPLPSLGLGGSPDPAEASAITSMRARWANWDTPPAVLYPHIGEPRKSPSDNADQKYRRSIV